MVIKKTLDHEHTTTKQTKEGDDPRAVLKGVDHENEVEIKIELKFKSGDIPHEYADVIGKPGSDVQMILANASTQLELETD